MVTISPAHPPPVLWAFRWQGRGTPQLTSPRPYTAFRGAARKWPWRFASGAEDSVNLFDPWGGFLSLGHCPVKRDSE
jgi:hypothetical protein